MSPTGASSDNASPDRASTAAAPANSGSTQSSSVIATRVLRADRRGSSLPVLVQSADGEWFTKLRGAAQGPSALVAEIIVAEIAGAIGLRVPAWRIVSLPAAIASDDPNDELRDLLDRSAGDNVGFEMLSGARDLEAKEALALDPAFAARVLWLDRLVQNVDRTAANPNIMVRRGTYWLIDHGVAMPFHHDWTAVTEATPERAFNQARHLFAWAAPSLPAVSVQLAPLLTRRVLIAASEPIPASLLPAGFTPTDAARRRAAYAAYLLKRVRHLTLLDAAAAER